MDINELANMTDEDFLKHSEEDEEDTPSEAQDEGEASSSGSEPGEVDGDPSEQGDSAEPDSDAESKSDDEPPSQAENTSVEETVPAVDPLENAEQYEQFYKSVMAPIKANGKTIQLRSANDVISLIQQGANYTKKMQAIAPYRKHLKMLEDNDLLDENKLRFLIDVSKGDKDAIKKLLYDSKIDANDVSYDEYDTDDEGNPKPMQYYPKTSTVSDQEVAWSDAWKELLEQEKLDNVDTHSIIMKMDAQSQKQVYENPQILSLMHVTQACGAYDKIMAEMDRLKTLGYIEQNAPFLSTFIQVKNIMLQQGLLNEEAQKATQMVQPTFAPQPQSLGSSHPVAPKPKFSNNAKARAAAPSRSSGKSTKPFLNPLNMSDEEFLKHYDEI